MFFFLQLFLFLLLHRHTTGCAGTGSCGTIISTTVGMCAARRQRGVAVHMMTSPRLGVSLFNKGKKEKEGAERRCFAYDQRPEAWKYLFSFFLFSPGDDAYFSGAWCTLFFVPFSCAFFVVRFLLYMRRQCIWPAPRGLA